jgi:quinol monooxygenase YgiN
MRMSPESVEPFLAAAADVSRATREESGCFAYHFSEDELEPGLVHVYERWTDHDTLMHHLTLDHVTTFRTTIGGLGARESDIIMYEVTPLGPPTMPKKS